MTGAETMVKLELSPQGNSGEICSWLYIPGAPIVGALSRPAGQIGENAMPTVRRSLSEILKSKPRVDLTKIRATSDKDIARMIEGDPDTAPDMSKDRDWRKVRAPRLP